MVKKSPFITHLPLDLRTIERAGTAHPTSWITESGQMDTEAIINQVVRETREILMDSSGLSGIMKGVGGCVVGYEFTRFAATIITASYFWRRRR